MIGVKPREQTGHRLIFFIVDGRQRVMRLEREFYRTQCCNMKFHFVCLTPSVFRRPSCHFLRSPFGSPAEQLEAANALPCTTENSVHRGRKGEGKEVT